MFERRGAAVEIVGNDGDIGEDIIEDKVLSTNQSLDEAVYEGDNEVDTKLDLVEEND